MALEGEDRTSQAQVYPPELRSAICRGFEHKKQFDSMRLFTIGSVESICIGKMQEAIQESDKLRYDENWAQAWDDVSRESLRPDVVRKARGKEAA